MNQDTARSTGLLDMPNETLLYIFEFLSYEEVAKYRIVCKRVDDICQNILNSGFQRAAQLHAATYKRIKAMLPRRESERRNHSLARHADILTSVETRISMLSMTYSKYMDMNMCCFIPGRVLDEIFRILRLTTRTWIPLRPLEILQEFRDISSMAIEHFDEKIAPEFKKTIELNSYAKLHHGGGGGGGGSGGGMSGNDIGASSSNNCVRRIKLAADKLPTIIINDYRRSKSHVLKPSDMKTVESAVQKQLQCDDLVFKFNDYPRLQQHKAIRTQSRISMSNLHQRVTTLQRKGVQQKKHLAFFARKVNGMTTQIAALKRRLDELDSKNQELIGTIRQYSLEDAQADQPATRSSETSEMQKSKDISLDNKEVISESSNLSAGQHAHMQSTSSSSEAMVMEKSACEFKLVRKALKRHFDNEFSENDDDDDDDNEFLAKTVEKKRKI